MSSPIDISEEAGVRYLHFGSDWIQGAMRIARPWALELDYTREMMASLLLRPEPEWPRSVLLIGLGAASLTKFLYRHRPQARLTVVEIEPAVVAAAQQFFRLPDDPKRLKLEIADGVEWLAASDETFDLILVDGFDADARAGALDTLPFYRACRAHLNGHGLLAVNLLGRNRGFGFFCFGSYALRAEVMLHHEIRDLVDRYNIKLKIAIDHFESNHLKRSKQKNNNPNKSYP